MPFDGKEGVAIELETNKIGILCALESGASTTNVRRKYVRFIFFYYYTFFCFQFHQLDLTINGPGAWSTLPAYPQNFAVKSCGAGKYTEGAKEMLMVVGGVKDDGSFINTALKFDIGAGRWTDYSHAIQSTV